MGSNPTPPVIFYVSSLGGMVDAVDLKSISLKECRFKSDSEYWLYKFLLWGDSLMVERESPKFLVWVRVPLSSFLLFCLFR